MLQTKRYFAVKLLKGGKLELIGFFSIKEREECCSDKNNHCRKITMKEWKNIPKEMKA